MEVTRKILIVDPSEVIRYFLRSIVQELSYTPVQAVDGQIAMKKMSEEGSEICLVITEWCLPGLSGSELLGNVKEDYPQLPVVFVTTATEKYCVIDALRLGAADYVVKPFSVKQIRDRIERFVVEK